MGSFGAADSVTLLTSVFGAMGTTAGEILHRFVT
jgi:hypothetical protein